MSERRWLPVIEPLSAALTPQQAYEDGTLPVMPVTAAIVLLNADLIHDRRELDRYRRRLAAVDSTDRAARMAAWQLVDAWSRKVNEHDARLQLLLNALTMHTLDWTHMRNDCLICQGEVTR